MIYSRLSRRLLRALNYKRRLDVFGLSSSPLPARAEIGELINAVTTNLTSFFRESHHFEHFRDEMIEPMAVAGQSRVRVWCAASSTGEEPYSIATTALSASSFQRFADFKLLATDLDTNVLAKASAGVYAPDRQKGLTTEQVDRFFVKAPNGDIEARRDVKSLITFRQLNLLHQWPMRGPFDVIFCRNVLIYFDARPSETSSIDWSSSFDPRARSISAIQESLLGDHPLLLSEGKTIYRRVK